MADVVHNSISIAVVVTGLLLVAMLPAQRGGRALRGVVARGLFCLLCAVIGLAAGLVLEFLQFMVYSASSIDPTTEGLFWIPFGFACGIFVGLGIQIVRYLRSRSE